MPNHFCFHGKKYFLGWSLHPDGLEQYSWVSNDLIKRKKRVRQPQFQKCYAIGFMEGDSKVFIKEGGDIDL